MENFYEIRRVLSVYVDAQHRIIKLLVIPDEFVVYERDRLSAVSVEVLSRVEEILVELHFCDAKVKLTEAHRSQEAPSDAVEIINVELFKALLLEHLWVPVEQFEEDHVVFMEEDLAGDVDENLLVPDGSRVGGVLHVCAVRGEGHE